ncbi:MAG: hypothetical protein OEY60_06065 [Nitrospira sp.]|nr:hypothetical protein [Nitrospira sp.]
MTKRRRSVQRLLKQIPSRSFEILKRLCYLNRQIFLRTIVLLLRGVQSRAQLRLSSLRILKKGIPSRLFKIPKRFNRQTRHYRLWLTIPLMSVKFDPQCHLSGIQLHKKQIPFRLFKILKCLTRKTRQSCLRSIVQVPS